MLKSSFGLLICGSRSINDYHRLTVCLDKLLARRFETNRIWVLTGDAKGADKLGNAYAKAHGLELITFPADWDKFGKSAGYIRNNWMLDYLTTYFDDFGMFAMWDGVSKGTRHSIIQCQERAIPFRVWNVKTNNYMESIR